MAVVTGCSRIIILLYAYCGVTGTHFTVIFLKTPRHPLSNGYGIPFSVSSVRVPNSDPQKMLQDSNATSHPYRLFKNFCSHDNYKHFYLPRCWRGDCGKMYRIMLFVSNLNILSSTDLKSWTSLFNYIENTVLVILFWCLYTFGTF